MDRISTLLSSAERSGNDLQLPHATVIRASHRDAVIYLARLSVRRRPQVAGRQAEPNYGGQLNALRRPSVSTSRPSTCTPASLRCAAFVRARFAPLRHGVRAPRSPPYGGVEAWPLLVA
jgi:hypothetical protein